ncbi:MAG: hypothetical protein R3C68_04335 [Myxococcota bacterium]
MSKVVHLSNEAHAEAKEFCKEHTLRMSDWVAGLIRQAIDARQVDMPQATPSIERGVVPKKRPLKRLDERPQPQNEDSTMPAYAMPPFWSRAQG